VIDLPVLRPAVEETAKPSGDSTRLFPALARRRFLVIDDEPTLVDLLHTFLTQQGSSVDTAGSGNLGLQKLLKEDYDAIVCDLRMPGLSGEELFRNLEEVKPAAMARFLFVTGDMLTDETRRFLESSGAAYVMKPFYLKDVARRLVAVVTGRRQDAPTEG
jgi:DNA-binding response OmpR family regulator